MLPSSRRRARRAAGIGALWVMSSCAQTRIASTSGAE